MAEVRPDLTAADIDKLLWHPSLLVAGSRGGPGEGPRLEIRFRHPERLPRLLRARARITSRPSASPAATDALARRTQNPWADFVIASGDQVLPVTLGVWEGLSAPSPLSLCLEFTDLPAARQRELLPYLKGLPCTEGLPIGTEEVRPLPGMATVTLKAHFADGTAAIIDPPRLRPALRRGTARRPVVVPTMQSRGSEWRVTNVSPGNWHYGIAGDDVSLTMNLTGMIAMKAGEHLLRDIEVHKGGPSRGESCAPRMAGR